MSSSGSKNKTTKHNNAITPVKLFNKNTTNSLDASSIPLNDNNNHNWEIQNSKISKRNLSSTTDTSTSSPIPQTMNTNKRKLPFITANRFQILSPNDDKEVFFPVQNEKHPCMMILLPSHHLLSLWEGLLSITGFVSNLVNLLVK